MAGIAAFGGYVPRYRLGAGTEGWGARAERAVANFDEDSVTMAVAAGLDCLAGRDRRRVDGLLFATTTPPYAEKGCAAIIAAALDLRRDIFAADITDSLRAGVTALKQALDAVAAGSAGQVLVIASDSRPGAPRGDAERNSGDGAAAFIVAADGVIAEQEGYYALTENMLDVWRSAGDPFLRSWEDRFAVEEGLERILGDAVAGYLTRQGLAAREVGKLALYAPDGRRHAQLARQLGFAPEQVQDAMFGRLGNTGAAFAPMLLAAALESAAPGQLVVAAAYGDGSEVIGFRATAPGGSGPAGGVTAHLNAGRTLDSYETYARWREVWVTDAASRRPPAPSPSVSALWREIRRPQHPLLRRRLQPVRLCAVPPAAGLRPVPGPGRRHAHTPQRPPRPHIHLFHGLPGRHHRHAAGHRGSGFRRRRPRPMHGHRPRTGRNQHRDASGDDVPQAAGGQRHS